MRDGNGASGSPLASGRGFALGCAAVGLLALALRLDFILAYRGSPLFESLVIDPATYDRWAASLAGGGDWTGGGVYPRAPLYVWFLASLRAVAGHSLFLPRLVQALLGSVSCVLLAVLGRRFLSPAASLGGALLAALSWPLIFFDAQLLFPSLIVFIELLFLLSLPGSESKSKSHAGLLLAGALLGLLALVNPLSLLLLPVFGTWLFLRGGRRYHGAVIFVLGCLLAVLPVTARNRIAGGEWTLISANGGYNFFVGNNARADGLSVWSSGKSIRTGEVEGGAAARPGEVSGYFYRRAWRWIAASPGDFLQLLLRKAYFLVNAREIPSNYPLDRMVRIVPSREGGLALLHFGIVGPFALLGCLFAWRRPPARPVLMYLLVSAAGIVMFFVNARYRVPLLPPLYLMAALGVSVLREAAGRGRRPLLTGVLLLLFLAVLVNSSAFGVGERRHEAPLYGELGRALARGGDLDQASTEFGIALELDPSRHGDRHNLASILVQQGLYEEAEKHFREVVAARPDYYQSWNSLGNLALMRGDPEEAVSLYRRALEVNPSYGLAAANLDEALKKLNEQP